jgi:hypothetical protein
MSLTDAKTGAEHSKIKTHFARIIVGWRTDDPYYSILYYDPADDEFHQGFGSYCLDNVIKWLSEEFEIIGDVFRCEPVRHGTWRNVNVPKKWGGAMLRCSECNTGVAWPWKYCPYCGAKMDAKEEQ